MLGQYDWIPIFTLFFFLFFFFGGGGGGGGGGGVYKPGLCFSQYISNKRIFNQFNPVKYPMSHGYVTQFYECPNTLLLMSFCRVL